MASRTSAGLGTVITISVMALLILTLFIAAVWAYSQMTRARVDLAAAENTFNEVITPSESGSAAVRGYLDRAGRERQSLTGYLISELRSTMTTAAGNADLSHEQLTQRVQGTTELEGGSLLARVDRLQARLAQADRARTEAEAARDRAAEDLRNEANRIRQVENELRQGTARNTASLDDYREGVENYQARIDEFIRDFRADLASLKDEQRGESDAFQDVIAQLEQDILVLRDRLERASGVARPEVLRPTDEFALVDGEVVATQSAQNTVTISLGARQKVTVGLTFSVYADASAIRPDDAGNYPQGKAALEVIAVQDNTATARVVRSTQGNPIVPGDVIANPLFDPDKVYKFIVYGNFDTDRDGTATRFEADRIESLIRQWGGQTVDEITGDLDFLVLGRQPVLPPQPGPGAPLEAVQEYVRLQNIVQRYNDLFDRAERTNIPVLNENRLYTLIGAFPR